jgi:hypothetical protein
MIATHLYASLFATYLLATAFSASQAPLILPVYERDLAGRIESIIRQKQEEYLYGAPRLGNISCFPSGTQGDALALQDLIDFQEENAILSEASSADAEEALRALDAVLSNNLSSPKF